MSIDYAQHVKVFGSMTDMELLYAAKKQTLCLKAMFFGLDHVKSQAGEVQMNWASLQDASKQMQDEAMDIASLIFQEAQSRNVQLGARVNSQFGPLFSRVILKRSVCRQRETRRIEHNEQRAIADVQEAASAA